MASSKFNMIDPLKISYEVSAEVLLTLGSMAGDYVVLKDTDPNGPTYLDVAEAVALRDWLNKAIPVETDLSEGKVAP